MKNERKIYILSSINNDEVVYKIGYTKNNVNERVKQLKTGNCESIDINYISEPTIFFSKIEKYLHKYYEEYNIDGEWFLLSKEEVSTIPNRINKLINTYQDLYNDNAYFKKEIDN